MDTKDAGRLGGLSKSVKKRVAAAINGAKGGRPGKPGAPAPMAQPEPVLETLRRAITTLPAPNSRKSPTPTEQDELTQEVPSDDMSI